MSRLLKQRWARGKDDAEGEGEVGQAVVRNGALPPAPRKREVSGDSHIIALLSCTMQSAQCG